MKVYPAGAFSGVFYSQWIERKDALFLRSHADLGKTFVDVGANVGIFSAQLFDKFELFFLIEPSASSIAALRETCKLNPGVTCIVVDRAISDEPGHAAFIDEGPFSTTSRLQTATQQGEVGRYAHVAVDTLDNVLGDRPEGVLLKIDVEGNEERVFRGAQRLLGAKTIKLAMFERLGRSDLAAISGFLASFGYTIFFVNENGTITRDKGAIAKPMINLFTCPTETFDANFSFIEVHSAKPN